MDKAVSFRRTVGDGRWRPISAPVISHNAVFTRTGCNIRTLGRAAIKYLGH